MASEDKKDGRVRKKNKLIILAAAEQEFLEHGFQGAAIKRIAERAKLPRANVHYYFSSKQDLYAAILNNIVGMWNSGFDKVSKDDDPRTALSNYIRAKVMFSKTDSARSRIFASEIIRGAPHLKKYLQTENKTWVQHKVKVIQAWIDAGKIDPIDPLNLLFFIWGATQHYADFGTQVRITSGKAKLKDQDFERIADDLIGLVLKGIGLKA
jgi:TetR/AcrR family transcriptional regulator